MSDYNYPHFPLDLDAATFAAFRDALKAGDRAPRGTLVDAATGEEVRLHRLWREMPLMIEFGSMS